MLTVSETSNKYKVGKSTLRVWMATGLLPWYTEVYKQRKIIVLREEDVISLLEERHSRMMASTVKYKAKRVKEPYMNSNKEESDLSLRVNKLEQMVSNLQEAVTLLSARVEDSK